MTREELDILFNERHKRCYVRSENIRIGGVYEQVELVPYIDSTIYRTKRLFGHVGNKVMVTGTLVDQECGVLFVTFKNVDSSSGILMPIGQFGYYFRKVKLKVKK